MSRHIVLAGFLLLLLTGVMAAEDETMLEVGAQGLVTIAFPNGTRTEMYPVIEGLNWAYSDCMAGKPTKGTAADLTGDGLTVNIPVRGGETGSLAVLMRLQVDPADARAVRFAYQFTAPEAVKLNCARLTFRLPIQPYSGQSVMAIEGPATMPQMPAAPLQGGHLLNATARGANIAEGQPHALRVELDKPAWCILDDSRRWTGADEYSLQLCAVVAPKGTSLAAGQSVSVSGLMQFASPVRVQAAPPGEDRALSFAAAKADVSNPWFPRLVDARGTTLLSVDVGQLGLPEFMSPEPQGEATVIDTATGEIRTTARLYANAKRSSYFEMVRKVASAPGSLRISDELTARGKIQSFGVLAWISLAPRLVEEGRHTAVFINETAHSIPILASGSGAKPVWETALGVRLQTADGQTAVDLGGDLPRTWGAWPGPRGGWLQQQVAGPGSVQTSTFRPDGSFRVDTEQNVFADGSVIRHTLTIQWPSKQMLQR
jgi:hypothetical protein